MRTGPLSRQIAYRQRSARLRARLFARLLTLFALLTAMRVAAQDSLAAKSAKVTVAPVGLVTVVQGKAAPVSVHFRVAHGYHINSNTPKSEFLIPTVLKMDLPTDIVLGKIDYPKGEDLSFPFSPDEKLNVYTGDFAVRLSVHPLHTVTVGKYAMHGLLRYQACDNAACYPPKTLPVNFDVKVAKAPPAPRANPRQSPHVHN